MTQGKNMHEPKVEPTGENANGKPNTNTKIQENVAKHLFVKAVGVYAHLCIHKAKDNVEERLKELRSNERTK